MPRLSKLSKTKFPARIALQFQEFLREYVRGLIDLTQKTIDNLKLRWPKRQDGFRADDFQADLQQTLQNLYKQMAALAGPNAVQTVAGQMVKAVAQQASEDVQKQLQQAAKRKYKEKAAQLTFVIPAGRGTPISQARIAESVRLIKSIPDDYHSKIESAVYESVTRGTGYDELAREIKNIGDVTASRAEMIAVDQTNKAYSQQIVDRYKSLGLNKMIWITSDDERVCPECEPLDGKSFTREELEEEGIPPYHVNCRCTTIADPDELEAAIENL